MFVKARSLSASCFDSDPSFLRSAVSFAPTGYPEVTPSARAKEAQPGTLNSGLMTGSSNEPAARVNPVEFIRSLATKKGNSEGTTMEDQSIRPFRAELTAVLEKTTIHMMNKRHSTGRVRCLIYITFSGIIAGSIKVNVKITSKKANII